MSIREQLLRCIVLLAGAHLNSAAAATLAGGITSSGGIGIRASVTLHDISTSRVQGQTPFDRQFSSKVDGTFSITGVPAGTYEICVDAPQANVLDPCLWSNTPPIVSVPASGDVNNVAITVDTGYLLTVHVNDPTTALPTPKGGTAGAALSVRVITRTNQHINFRLASTSALAWDHYLLVPFDQSMILAIESSTLALSNATNQPYKGNSLRLPVHIPKGGSLPTVTVGVAQATATASPTSTAKP